jgi:hypothetical protein
MHVRERAGGPMLMGKPESILQFRSHLFSFLTMSNH